jgi:hypothetical protein
MVASRTQSAVTQVVHTLVVDTTAAHPETETMDTESTWARVPAALRDVRVGEGRLVRFVKNGTHMARQNENVAKR